MLRQDNCVLSVSAVWTSYKKVSTAIANLISFSALQVPVQLATIAVFTRETDGSIGQLIAN